MFLNTKKLLPLTTTSGQYRAMLLCWISSRTFVTSEKSSTSCRFLSENCDRSTQKYAKKYYQRLQWFSNENKVMLRNDCFTSLYLRLHWCLPDGVYISAGSPLYFLYNIFYQGACKQRMFYYRRNPRMGESSYVLVSSPDIAPITLNRVFLTQQSHLLEASPLLLDVFSDIFI